MKYSAQFLLSGVLICAVACIGCGESGETDSPITTEMH